ncbi:hypothetical protein [Dysgonomonas capnocytophagoides]|uniref:hypothetical protein n=1 Tax=Dysgonomonas capnocytophagoides TaxID=45254 RepID=UPI0029203847|nr:hypothetical protein DCPSUM001_24650 [Dysgonomonas capnocytophagoides]
MKQKKIEDLNVAVFTTKYVLEQQSPIIYVFHYEDDGAWQFSGDEDCDENDYRIVSFEEIISLDASILEVVNIPLGYYAKRKDKESHWDIELI